MSRNNNGQLRIANATSGGARKAAWDKRKRLKVGNTVLPEAKAVLADLAQSQKWSAFQSFLSFGRPMADQNGNMLMLYIQI